MTSLTVEEINKRGLTPEDVRFLVTKEEYIQMLREYNLRVAEAMNISIIDYEDLDNYCNAEAEKFFNPKVSRNTRTVVQNSKTVV